MAKKKSAKKSVKSAKKAAAKGGGFSPEEAEKMAKQAASKRTITIELTSAQLSALTQQWKNLKPAEAAELVFTDGGAPTSCIKVAGYSYHGNTCCA